MTSNRYKEVDRAKGIGVILVIIGHILTGGGIRGWIYSFHMPLFFFLAGAVYKKEEDFWTLLKRKIRTILVPYWCMGTLLICVDFLKLYLDEASSGEYFTLLFQFYIWGRKYVLWFLPCLFFINIMWALLQNIKVGKNRAVLVFVVTIITLVGYRIGLLKLPCSLDTSFVGLSFFGLGYLYFTQRAQLLKKMNVYIVIIIGILCLSINIGLVYVNINLTGHYLDMNSNIYELEWLTMPAAILGVVSVLCFSSKVESRVLEYLGANSMTYFAFHQLFIRVFNIIFDKFNVRTNVWRAVEIVSIVVVLTGVNEIILRTPICFIVGKKRRSKD